MTRDRAIFLQDTLVAAVEGGTGYWASVSDYHWSDEHPEQARVTLHEEEYDSTDHRGPDHTVTPSVIAKGLAVIRAAEARGVAVVRRSTQDLILEADRTNDGGMIDADAADLIVQLALFNTLVYG